jgi:hypothetical protein
MLNILRHSKIFIDSNSILCTAEIDSILLSKMRTEYKVINFLQLQKIYRSNFLTVKYKNKMVKVQHNVFIIKGNYLKYSLLPDRIQNFKYKEGTVARDFFTSGFIVKRVSNSVANFRREIRIVRLAP